MPIASLFYYCNLVFKMNYYIVIPAHNEEAYLADTLNSVLRQSLPPTKVVIVNDNSTDGTETIINKFLGLSPIFEKLNTKSSTIHMPGSKVINAFNKGLTIISVVCYLFNPLMPA